MHNDIKIRPCFSLGNVYFINIKIKREERKMEPITLKAPYDNDYFLCTIQEPIYTYKTFQWWFSCNSLVLKRFKP